MPLSSSLVGATSGPQVTRVDARWTMAYAAGLGHAEEHYLDPLRADGIIAHPLFPVCVEWSTGQAIAPPGPTGMEGNELRRGVHYAHDLVLHQPVRPPMGLCTTSRVVGVRRHRAGAILITRIDAADADGAAPCWTTWMTSLFRGVEVDGDDAIIDEPPPIPELGAAGPAGAQQPLAERALDIPATAAHVYTECARIWNPIHTDTAVARAAGLPGIILHGTASLALAVSSIADMAGVAEPADINRIFGRFSAIVTMPTTLKVRLLATADGWLAFDACTPDGAKAVSHGVIQTGART